MFGRLQGGFLVPSTVASSVLLDAGKGRFFDVACAKGSLVRLQRVDSPTLIAVREEDLKQFCVSDLAHYGHPGPQQNMILNIIPL